MGDPLEQRYRDSWLRSIDPNRPKSAELGGRDLKQLSQKIQSTGAHPGEPPPPIDPPVPSRAFRMTDIDLRGTIPDPPGWSQTPALAPPAPPYVSPLRAAQGSQANASWLAKKAEYDILWKLYERMVADEYAAINKPGASWYPCVKEFEERGGLRLYRDLRPVYFRAKVREPHLLIMEMESGKLRLGDLQVNQGYHPKFAAYIRRADSRITAAVRQKSWDRFGSANPLYVGCFRPDALDPTPNNPLPRLSNHMIGGAIDIDATRLKTKRNPNILQNQLKALDLLLASRAGHTSNPSGPPLRATGSWLSGIPNLTDEERGQQLYDTALRISEETKAFLLEHLDAWIAFKAAPTSLPEPAASNRKVIFDILQELSKAFGGVKALQNIRAHGFISIPAEFFRELLGAGLQSGAQYRESKDIMHFEIKNPNEIIGANGYP